MKKLKKIGVGIGFLVFIAILGCMNWLWNDWSIRYKSQLDRFFGKGNWEVVSDDLKYTKVHITRQSLIGDYDGERERIGYYRVWNILCENGNGDEEIWEVSNGVYVANHKRYGVGNSKRYTGKQALTLELMDISFAVIEEEIYDEMMKAGLSEEEVECFNARISYHGGNTKPSFYSKLAKESWFTIEGVRAENYLASDLYDFYLDIKVFDYKFESLSEEEQENVKDCLEKIEERLLDKYGDDASFELYCGDYDVEYVDGEKQ